MRSVWGKQGKSAGPIDVADATTAIPEDLRAEQPILGFNLHLLQVSFGVKELRICTMRTIQFALLLAVLAGTASADDDFWFADAEQAQRLAEHRRLPLLIHFSGMNCPHCVAMERTVFADRSVQSRLREVIAVHLNRDVDLEYSRRFGVTHVPADVIIHTNGRIEKQVGRKDKDAYLRMLSRLLAEQDSELSRVVELPRAGVTISGQSAGTAMQTAEEQGRPTADAELFNQQTPGLQGYCPVSLSQLDQLVPGSKTHSVIRDGIRYYFASSKMREEFLNAPRRNLPECLGCDPVILTRELRAIPGDPTFRVRFDGRLWLFTSEKTRAEFLSSPLRFSTVRSALRSKGLHTIQ